MRYSELDISALSEGEYTVGADKAFVPHAPGDPHRKGALHVAVNPFVVRTPREVFLVDCGLGELARGRTIAFLLDNLRRAGVEREEVTRVLLSHLHFDHCGGAVFTAEGQTRVTFPNAEYYAQRREVEAAYTGRSDEIRTSVVEALERSGQLVLQDGDGPITPEVECRVTGGHTEHHQAFLFHSGGRTALFAGDVLSQPAQATRRYAAKYDFDPEAARAWRERLVEEAAEHGWLLLFYHSTREPAGFVSAHGNGYAVERVAL